MSILNTTAPEKAGQEAEKGQISVFEAIQKRGNAESPKSEEKEPENLFLEDTEPEPFGGLSADPEPETEAEPECQARRATAEQSAKAFINFYEYILTISLSRYSRGDRSRHKFSKDEKEELIAAGTEAALAVEIQVRPEYAFLGLLGAMSVGKYIEAAEYRKARQAELEIERLKRKAQAGENVDPAGWAKAKEAAPAERQRFEIDSKGYYRYTDEGKYWTEREIGPKPPSMKAPEWVRRMVTKLSREGMKDGAINEKLREEVKSRKEQELQSGADV